METIAIGPCKCGGYGQVFNEQTEERIGVCHRKEDSLLGFFVTAKLKGQDDSRQGWVTSIDPLMIRGESGVNYECAGNPVLVTNPPA